MYESFFGLTGLPFQLTPDTSFVFDAKSQRDAFSAIQQGFAAGAAIMVLTGEAGAGKTTLLQTLLASVDRASFVPVHTSAARLDDETLVDRMSEGLGLPQLTDPLARREALLARLRSGPNATLLVIDEAQDLAPDGFALLETMAKVAAASPARLLICLFGQPELRILLNATDRSGLRELIGVDRHLGPLEQAEISSYVEHRLLRAGWTGRPEFDDAAFFEIFVFTGGIPRRVNLLCNSLMLSAWIKGQQRIDAPAVTRAAAAMRGDSFHGEPDLQHVGSPLEQSPELVEVCEPGSLTAQADAQPVGGSAHADHIPEATRPTDEGPVDPPPLVPSESIVSSPEGPLQQPESASRRRRRAILASAASIAVALAVIAWMVDQRGFHPSESKSEVRGVVADGAGVPGGPTAPLGAVRRSTASTSGTASSSTSAAAPSPLPEPTRPVTNLDTATGKAARGRDEPPARGGEQQRGAAIVAPDHSTAANPAAEGSSRQPSCSAPAFALGLCDADPSSAPRR